MLLVHVSDSAATSRVSCVAVGLKVSLDLRTKVRLLNGLPIFVGSRLQARRDRTHSETQRCFFSVDHFNCARGKLPNNSPK